MRKILRYVHFSRDLEKFTGDTMFSMEVQNFEVKIDSIFLRFSMEGLACSCFELSYIKMDNVRIAYD